MSAPKFSPGTRVRLTGAFLRNTGNYTGPDSRGKWAVVGCACDLCGTNRARWTAVNEPHLANDGPRHFASDNLQAIR
jgi:hypothetical protein